MAAGILAHRFITENILAIIGFVLAVLMLLPFGRWLVHLDRKTNSGLAVLPPVVLIIILFLLTFALMAHQLGKSSPLAEPGKNINACGYNHNFTDFGSESLEKLIEKKCGKSKNSLVARIDRNDYHEVFLSTENEVTAYEFAEQDKRYFYLGMRKLVYHAARYPASSYSWQETVFSDAAQSRLSHGIRMFQNGYSDPAWGVTDFNPEKSIRIRGKSPDMVKELKTSGGPAVYLWIYQNLGNTAELKLRDVDVEEP
jgi:hypothetical protein